MAESERVDYGTNRVVDVEGELVGDLKVLLPEVEGVFVESMPLLALWF